MTLDEHCKDCCCAKAWNALGITEYTGKSIAEHIAELKAPSTISREELERAAIAVHGFHTTNGWDSSETEWKNSCRELASVTLATLGITVGE